MAAQKAQTCGDPGALGGEFDAGELRDAMKIDEAAAMRLAKMTITMQADGCAGSFEGAHLIPKICIRRRGFQFRIVIVGNDGEYWSQMELGNESGERRPTPGGDGGRKIVKAEEISRAHEAASACASSFALQ